jgi:ABC-type dipeptide/oligopeptide/nickel transport system ATPase subunit
MWETSTKQKANPPQNSLQKNHHNAQTVTDHPAMSLQARPTISSKLTEPYKTTHNKRLSRKTSKLIQQTKQPTTKGHTTKTTTTQKQPRTIQHVIAGPTPNLVKIKRTKKASPQQKAHTKTQKPSQRKTATNHPAMSLQT